MYEALMPIFACLVVFGAPGLYLHIVRSSRVRLRELELGHDSKLAELTRERDVLQAKVDQMEPNLEFFRQLATGDQAPRKRVAVPAGLEASPQMRAPIEIYNADPDSDAHGEVTAVAKAPLK